MIPALRPHVSDLEAMLYYRGLPSKPRLIARTGSPWPWEAPTDPEAPSGPDAYPPLRELRFPGEHKIHEIWEDNLAFKVHAIRDQAGVDWSSTEIVRIGDAGNTRDGGDLTLWIGVWDWRIRRRPAPLAYDVAIDAAFKCKALLLEHGIEDVDVEMRDPPTTWTPTAFLREPFTTTLGIPIRHMDASMAGGTGGLFLQVDDPDGKKLFLVTARHVVFPRSDNSLFERKSDRQPRRDVHVVSVLWFRRHLMSIQKKITSEAYIINYQKNCMNSMADREDATAMAVREDAQRLIKKSEDQVQALEDFNAKLLRDWNTFTNRTLGHVVYSLPIVVGAGTEQKGYIQDVAVIAIDPSKIDPDSFTGNVIDLGNKYTPDVLTPMMRSNCRDAPDGDFVFPGDRLLKLRGTIKEDEMRKPNMCGSYGDGCIVVLKRGGATGLTVGRALNSFAYVRNYIGDNDDTIVSKEWAVISYNESTGRFSGEGDSGSAVVDGAGRIGVSSPPVAALLAERT
ncbi:hypothetical protein BC826DRAFT_1106543 [Russula brevipes]|nr:hypothetical protein BC826DRAFT_1106543 [Russula brevipes]